MKKWLITATVLVLVGLLVFGGVMTVLKWDFKKLSTEKFETNIYSVKEEFSNIKIDTSTADVIFLLSSDDNCRVECFEEAKEKHQVFVSNDTLTVKVVKEKKWYDYIGINFNTPKIKLYLTKDTYNSLNINDNTGDILIPKEFEFSSVDMTLSTGKAEFFALASELLRIKAGTGKVNLGDITAGDVIISTTTGDITVSNTKCSGNVSLLVSTGDTVIEGLECNNFAAKGNTGDIKLTDVIVKETLFVSRSTGKVDFSKCDADEIKIQTDTGNINGSLLSDKVFTVSSATGSVNVPETTGGGKCEITAETGNIKITIEK